MYFGTAKLALLRANLYALQQQRLGRAKSNVVRLTQAHNDYLAAGVKAGCLFIERGYHLPNGGPGTEYLARNFTRYHDLLEIRDVIRRGGLTNDDMHVYEGQECAIIPELRDDDPEKWRLIKKYSGPFC